MPWQLASGCVYPLEITLWQALEKWKPGLGNNVMADRLSLTNGVRMRYQARLTGYNDPMLTGQAGPNVNDSATVVNAVGVGGGQCW